MTFVIVIVLVLLSGLFSGLTLGLMGLSAQGLKRKAALGDERAKKVYSVRRDGNLLLTTLLVGNVAVNTALSIFLGSLAPGVIAGLIATSLIVVFGEIMPQATFSRHGLALGSRVVWLVHIFIFILYPICKPIAWLLDKTLGHELPSVYSKRELIKLIEEHKYSDHSDVDDEEEQIIRGALSFSTLRAKDIMTRRDKAFMLEKGTLLTDGVLNTIRENGHTRIPIYEEDESRVVGVLRTKELLGRDLEESTVGSMMHSNVVRFNENHCLDDIFEKFIDSKQHLFIVENKDGKCIGIVSLEDVIEEIIREEIEDESD
jgi:metal transporter CNNM